MPCDSKAAAPATGIPINTCIDRIAARLVGGAQKRIGRAADPQALRRRGEHHRLRFGKPGCQRLFQIDVLAGLDDLQAHRRMGRWHSQVHHDLDFRIGEQSVDRHRLHASIRSLRVWPLRHGYRRQTSPAPAAIVPRHPDRRR